MNFHQLLRGRFPGIHRTAMLDGLCVAFLVIAMLVHAWNKVDFQAPPMEDPAMLMRYALNLAEGHGIVWNVGEPPVDGATDFLFTVMTAGLTKAGVPVDVAVRLISLVAHLLTVALVYLSMARLLRVGRFAALISALYLAFGPAFYYVAVGYATPFFALTALVTWLFALKLNIDGDSWGVGTAFALSALITGLVRPEGVFLAGLMLVSVVYANGLQRSRATIICFLAVFLVLGGAFLMWRWNYFGYPLPNPLYKKSEGVLHFGSLDLALLNLLFFTLPFGWSYLLAFRRSSSTRMALFYFIPVIGFCLLWVLIDSEMNHLGRYQYPVLALALMGWPGILREALKDYLPDGLSSLDWRSKVAFVLVFAFVFWQPLFLNERIIKPRSHPDGRKEVAQILSHYKDKRYSMAVTESGLLPLFSGWGALDAWGLNNSWIAHHGGVNDDCLAGLRPELIMFHANFSPLVAPSGKGKWYAMVQTMQRYAERHGYRLAAVFGPSPYDTHYYYVRSDFPDSAEIVDKIRSIRDYRWYRHGERCMNFAVVRP